MSRPNQLSGDPSLRWLLVGAAVLVLVSQIVWWLISGLSFGVGRADGRASDSIRPVPPPTLTRRATSHAGDSTVLRPDADGFSQVPELVQASLQISAAEGTIERDLDLLSLLLTSFRKLNQGAPPVSGENQEVVTELQGHNTSKLRVLATAHPAINDHGQLLDRWGTPFVFHPVSRDEWEIRSAGPDRKLYTPDDAIQP